MNTFNFNAGILLLLLLTVSVHAQNRNTLSVTNRSTSHLRLPSPSGAGKSMEVLLDNTQWLNYSVQVDQPHSLLSVSASVASGNIPPGVEVYLEASHDHGSGWGKKGQPTGKIMLGTTPGILISEVGTSSTGFGKFHGHKLTMTVVIKDYSLLQSGDFNLFIQYTLN
jgi:hypothetical protein